MPINPAMLMLSAANPGLLPLAFESDSMQSSSHRSVTHTHNHKHAHEHDFKKGSGEELRGIAIQKADAVNAYQVTLKNFAEWEENNREAIQVAFKKYNEAMDAIQDSIKERTKEREDRHAELNEKRKEYEIAQSKIKELKKTKKGLFGYPHAVNVEIKKLEDVSEKYSRRVLSEYSDWPIDRFSYLSYLANPQEELLKLKRKVKERLAVATLAIDTMSLNRTDVLEIADMLNGEWLEKQEAIRAIFR